MKNIMIEGTSFEEFQVKLADTIKSCLEELKTNKKPSDELLTREETAKYLKVSTQTLFNWSKSKILIPCSIGNRIYYRKEDVLNSLRPIPS
jgi:hypothetical protein